MGKKTFLKAITCAIMAISLTSCGKQGAVSDSDNPKDYVYVPEYITLSNDENSYFNNPTLKENTIYYSNYTYDEETMTSSERICKYSLEDGSVESVAIAITENQGLNGYALDKDGNIYVLLSDYSVQNEEVDGYSVPNMYIGKYDAQGNFIYKKDITDVIYRDSSDTYARGIFVDGQGNIYVGVESAIMMFNSDGEEYGVVSVSDGWISNIGLGKDGKVYFSYYDYTSATGGMVLSEIDFKGKKIGATYSNIPNMNGERLSVGATKDFLINDGSKVYEYDMASQTYEEIFAWVDCDINGSYVSYVGATEDGAIVAIINDWDTGITELAKMKKTAASEVEKKEEIVIAALYDDQQLQASVVAFNKANEKYRVTIKNYIDSNNWEDGSYETAITNLQNDIISGTNCPDIIDLSQIGDERALAQKGVFEDLTPYLEKSSVLSKEEFLDTILEGFSYNGKLLSLPTTFQLNTLVGKTSVVGEEIGWSMEDMMTCAEKYPEAELMEGYQKHNILQTALMFNESSYINWEENECYFNTDGFKQVLEFANMFPAEIDWANYDGSGRIEKLQTNAVLLEAVGVYDLQEIQLYEAQFGEPVTFVGYPSTDGTVGCVMYANARYGIVAKSDNKDGAWAFIESYLTNTDDRYSWGIPTRKEALEEMIKEATTPEEGFSSSMSSDGWEYTYHTPTEEDVQVLRDLIAVAKPMGMIDENLFNIIIEEAEGYFTGEKSVDEVAEIIQNRAQIYISENS